MTIYESHLERTIKQFFFHRALTRRPCQLMTSFRCNAALHYRTKLFANDRKRHRGYDKTIKATANSLAVIRATMLLRSSSVPAMLVYYAPAPMLLSDVCLSIAYIGPKSRTERPRKTKTGTEIAHVTRNSDITFKVKRSRSPGRFTQRGLNA